MKFTFSLKLRMNQMLSYFHFSLTKDQAHDLVFRLNPDERKILAQTLSMFQSNSDKTQLEGKRKFW